MASTATLAKAIGISDRKLRQQLLAAGLGALLDEARRLQMVQAFEQRQWLGNDEPIPVEMVKQAYAHLFE